MAKHQYRISTLAGATQGYGFAFLALTNPSDSGRKLTVRSLETISHCASTTVTPFADLFRGTALRSGSAITAMGVRSDTSYELPSTLSVLTHTGLDSYITRLLRFSIARQAGGVATHTRPIFGVPSVTGIGARRKAGGGSYAAPLANASQEPITIGQNEAVALMHK